MEGEDYSGWSLRDRLELFAFEARLAGVPQALLGALWEAIDGLAADRGFQPAGSPDFQRRLSPFLPQSSATALRWAGSSGRLLKLPNSIGSLVSVRVYAAYAKSQVNEWPWRVDVSQPFG
jgi:hypothetical protein